MRISLLGERELIKNKAAVVGGVNDRKQPASETMRR